MLRHPGRLLGGERCGCHGLPWGHARRGARGPAPVPLRPRAQRGPVHRRGHCRAARDPAERRRWLDVLSRRARHALRPGPWPRAGRGRAVRPQGPRALGRQAPRRRFGGPQAQGAQARPPGRTPGREGRAVAGPRRLGTPVPIPLRLRCPDLGGARAHPPAGGPRRAPRTGGRSGVRPARPRGARVAEPLSAVRGRPPAPPRTPYACSRRDGLGEDRLGGAPRRRRDGPRSPRAGRGRLGHRPEGRDRPSAPSPCSRARPARGRLQPRP